MRSALAQPAFRNLWIGQALSSVGDAMVLIVIGLFVTDLTGEGSDVGLVLAAYAAPMVVFLLMGGVLADRMPRRTVMLWCDAVRAVLHALVAALIAVDAAEVWHLVVVGALFGTAGAFFRPAYSGLVPQCVPEELIQPAQALTGASRQAAIIVGPALGTALVVAAGAAAAYALDAATFVVSIAFLLRVHPRERGAATERSTVVRELREGWDAVRERAWVWATIAGFSIVMLCGLAPYYTLGAAVAEQEYDHPGVFGLVQAMAGAGMVTGTLWAARWSPRFPLRLAMYGHLLWPVSLVAFALGAPVTMLVLVTLAGGVGLGLFGVWWETALAQRIPAHLLSRVSAYDWMGSVALVPVGYVAAGVLGDALGGAPVMLAGGCVSIAALAAALLPRETRMLTRLDPAQA
jgi:predicted MFS family arabinose efflux permease